MKLPKHIHIHDESDTKEFPFTFDRKMSDDTIGVCCEWTNTFTLSVCHSYSPQQASRSTRASKAQPVEKSIYTRHVNNSKTMPFTLSRYFTGVSCLPVLFSVKKAQHMRKRFFVHHGKVWKHVNDLWIIFLSISVAFNLNIISNTAIWGEGSKWSGNRWFVVVEIWLHEALTFQSFLIF